MKKLLIILNLFFFLGTAQAMQPIPARVDNRSYTTLDFDQDAVQNLRNRKQEVKRRRKAVINGVCIGLASSLSSIALLSFFPDSYAATAGAYGLSFSSPTITSKITGTGVAQGITQVDIKKQGDVKVKKTRPVEGTYHRTARFADLATTGIVGCVSGKIDIFLVKFFGWLLA